LRTQIVIVGAGPAGGNAARLLSSQGYRVHVIDVRSEVGRPVQCGEAISEFALRDNAIAPDEWVVHRVKGIAVHSPEGGTAYVPVKGYCVDRSSFDRSFVDEALAAGAGLTTHCRALAAARDDNGWRVHTSKGPLRADALIAADGPRSPTAASLGLLESASSNVGLQYKFPSRKIDVEEEWLHLYLSQRYGGGYAWIFPRDRVVSIGVDVTRGAKPHLHTFCRSLGLDVGERIATNGGLIPVHLRLTSLAAEGFMVVGDAAGATNPIFGGGIHAALSTSRMAAESLLADSDEWPGSASIAYRRRARSSPFFDPVLSFVARRLHSATDMELNLAIEAFRSRREPRGLAEMASRFLRHPTLIARALEMPLLWKALKLTITYGW
jgi:geranylgeranyl reductase family protein